MREEGFAFARDLVKPEIRARLRELGYDGTAGDRMVLWRWNESADDAACRAEGARRVLLVCADDNQPDGWRLEWLPPHAAPLPVDSESWVVDEVGAWPTWTTW